MKNLDFLILKENKELVSETTYQFILRNFQDQIDDFKVALIDPESIDGSSLFKNYDLSSFIGINCLICEVIKNDERKLVALLVPVGYKYNMSTTVRKYYRARRVSVAPLEEVLNKTQMEYGSINPLGLPSDISILYDPLILTSELAICGSGIKETKIMLPSKYISQIPNAKKLENLAKNNQI